MLRCNAYKCYQAARKVTERLSDSAQMNFPAAVGSYQGLKDAGPVNGDDRSLDRRLSGDPGRRGGIHNRWGKRRKARSRAGEIRSYEVPVTSSHYFRFTVEVRRARFLVKLLRPDGSTADSAGNTVLQQADLEVTPRETL